MIYLLFIFVFLAGVIVGGIAMSPPAYPHVPMLPPAPVPYVNPGVETPSVGIHRSWGTVDSREQRLKALREK